MRSSRDCACVALTLPTWRLRGKLAQFFCLFATTRERCGRGAASGVSHCDRRVVDACQAQRQTEPRSRNHSEMSSSPLCVYPQEVRAGVARVANVG